MISPLALHRIVVGFFAALARYSIRYPRRVIIMALALTLGVAPGAVHLTLRTDGHALVSQDAPEVRYDRTIRDEFGIEDPVVVLIHSPHADGIFNAATLQLVRELTGEFIKLERVRSNNVVSLATEHGFRNRPASLQFQTLLENPRRTREELEQLRDDLRRIELYTGTIVSFDGRSTAILVGAPDGLDRTVLYRRIRDLIAAKGPLPESISVTGPPVAEALLGTHILEDLGVPRFLLGASTRVSADTRGKLPASFYEFRLFIARRIGLVPIAVLVMALIFQVSFRRFIATLLPMAEVGACLAFVFGLMGWLGVPVYLTIAVMPVLLTAMAVTDEIHVYSRYFALLHERPGGKPAEMVQAVMDEMVCPVVNTSLTTAIGFVSFAFSPLGPVQAFGIFTAIGVLFCLFWSLSVMPALLTIISPQWVLTRRAGKQSRAGLLPAAVTPRTSGGRGFAGGQPKGLPYFGRFALWVVGRRYWVLGTVALIVALTPFGLRRLVIQDSWIDGFDPDSDFGRATRLVNEQFHGMHLLYATLDAGEILRGRLRTQDVGNARFSFPTNLIADPPSLVGRWLYILIEDGSNGPPRASWRSTIESAQRAGDKLIVTTQIRDQNSSVWLELPRVESVGFEIVSQPHLQPQIMKAIADLGAFIEQKRSLKVGKVLAAPDYVSTTRFMVRPDEPGSRRVPSDPGEIKLLWDYYRIVRGPEQLRHVVDTNYTRSLATIFLKEANFVDTAKLMDELRAYERERLAPLNIRLGFAGDVAVSQSLIRGIVTTQTQSLFWSLVGIYAVTALLGRSLRCGVYAVIPCALSVLLNFAVMGWLNIPLGVATSMFAAMTLGIGVDFAVHVLEGYELSRTRGLSSNDALVESMGRTGPAVVINTLAVALGFGVLTLSQVPANARLGGLTILGMVTCLLATLLLLPVLLHWWPLKSALAAESRQEAKSAKREKSVQ
jgi:predicted RND superfamily exporter protein